MKKNAKVFIVEDMAVTRIALESMLTKNGYEVIGSAAKAEVAWKKLESGPIDLLLLDINLVGSKSGLWLAEKVREKYDYPIVYLTAYGDEETRNQVLSTNPNGYVMKPFNEPTVLTTMAIALEKYKKSMELESRVQMQEQMKKVNDVIYIKDSHLRVRVELSEILYVQSDGNYVNIVLPQKQHLVRNKLYEFSNLLPSEFIQIHQRYIINTRKIQAVGKSYVTIKGTDIPISRTYRSDLDDVLNFI